MCVHHIYAVPTEARKGCQIFWNRVTSGFYFILLNLFIYSPHTLYQPFLSIQDPCMQVLSPFSLEKEDPLYPARQGPVGLGISSPTEARECCLFRGAGSTERHTDSGTALAPDVWVTHIKTKLQVAEIILSDVSN